MNSSSNREKDGVNSPAVLVTGAYGFVGRSLISRLASQGRKAIALDVRGIAPAAEACDVADAEQLEAVFTSSRIEAIVHLAAVLPTAARQNPALATRVNIEGSANLLEMARKHSVRRFVLASSLSVYGPGPDDAPVAEDYAAAPQELYGAAKRYVEVLGENYADSFGLEFAALRISTVIGPGGRSTSSPWRSDIFAAVSAKHPSSVLIPYGAAEFLPLVHVEELVTMLLMVVDSARPAYTIYNCVSETWRMDELKGELESLNPQLRIDLGERVAGIPKHIDDARFRREFRYTATPLREYFRRAATARREATQSRA